MSSYDIFVLVCAVIIFSFLFKILAGILRILKSIFGVFSRPSSNTEVNTEPPKITPSEHTVQQSNTSSQYTNQTNGSVSHQAVTSSIDQDAINKFNSEQILEQFSDAIARVSTGLINILSDNYSLQDKPKLQSMLVPLFIISTFDRYKTGYSDELSRKFSTKVSERIPSLDSDVLTLSVYMFWSEYAKEKPNESRDFETISRLFLKVIGNTLGFINSEVSTLVGHTCLAFFEKTDEAWNSIVSDVIMNSNVDSDQVNERIVYVDRTQKEVTCPYCKKIQKSDRDFCYNCSAPFVDAH